MQFPITVQDIYLHDVTTDAQVYLFHANKDKITESECGTMDCDGMKKNLISDKDGSFLGQPGTVISMSEYEWGTESRNLGNCRIPLDMLTAPDGSFIKPSLLYKYPGIDRDQSLCTYKAAWQGYMCSTIDHKMMVIESMDEDTRKHL